MPSPLTLLAEAIQSTGPSDDRRQEPPLAEHFDNVRDPTQADLETHLNNCTSLEDTVAENLHNLRTQMVYCSELNTDNVWVISNIITVEKIEVRICGKLNSPRVTLSGGVTRAGE